MLNTLLLTLTIISLGCSRPVKDIRPIQVTPSTLFAHIDGTVMGISQDAKGVMWFLSFDSYPELTSSTLFAFDGNNWDERGHYHNMYPEGIYHDSDGNTWIFDTWILGTNALIYDGKSLKQSRLAIETSSGSFTQSNLGNLWWKDSSNVNRFNGKDILKIPIIPLPKNYNVCIHSVLEDNRGNYWFATSYGVWCYANNTWRDTGPSEWHAIAWDLDVDKNGIIWASVSWAATSTTVDRGIFCYNEIGEDTKGTWTQPEPAIRPDANYYTDNDIVRDSNGNLWVLTRGDGVYRFDGQNWKHFTTDDGLIQNENRLVFADSEGNLWLVAVNIPGSADNVTPQCGVCRFDGSDWKKFGTSDGLPARGISSIFEDKGGDIWFGSYDGGVYRFTPTSSN
jgi:ligand-binding sensor domain-containing protein